VLGLIAGLLGGFLSPYYLGPFLVLLTLLLLGKIVIKEWHAILVYAGTVAAAITGFIIQNLDVIVHSVTHGKNHEAVSRNLWWMVKFALIFRIYFSQEPISGTFLTGFPGVSIRDMCPSSSGERASRPTLG
jgi:hypothetical protein